MASEAAKTDRPIQSFDEWNPPEPPTDLIFDDGVPLESNRHRIAMNVLIDSALNVLQENPNSFVGGNMFVYYSRNQSMNRDFRGPDFFVVLDAEPDRERQGWVVWEEDGRYPHLIIELMSPSTAKVDLEEKKLLYERTFRTSEYFVYDPFNAQSFQGWRLGSSYQPIQPNDRGWLWCSTLKVWLGVWNGCIRREPPNGTCDWLRMYDRAGNVILLQEEIAAQERQIADQERLRAEQERQIADQERLRAEQERQIADQERQRAERLAARLRELGEDPDR